MRTLKLNKKVQFLRRFNNNLMAEISNFRDNLMAEISNFRDKYLKEYLVMNTLKHVKAWLISSTDDWKDKTVYDLKSRCFYPRGSQKLVTN